MARGLLDVVPEGTTMSLAAWAARAAMMVTGTLFAVGCSHTTESASVGFALPSTTAALVGARPIETNAVRVLATRIDLRQPVFVQRVGDAVEVTYAVRERDGVTIRLEPRTLQPLGEPSAYLYPRCSAREPAAYLSRDVARVELSGGEEVTVFTSDEHNRAFARVGNAAPVAVSPEGMSIIGPARANTDGTNIVAVFVTATEAGFQLIATSLHVRSH